MRTLYPIEMHIGSTTPASGKSIVIPGWAGNSRTYLKDSEIPEFGAFRIPSGSHAGVEYLANVKVTGRKVHYYRGDSVVKIKITFIDEEQGNSEVQALMVV